MDKIELKFKYKDKVKFDDIFYGKCEGEVVDWNITGISEWHYQIKILKGKAKGQLLFLSEGDLK